MNTQKDAITIILANRSYLYVLLQHLFGHEPNPELLQVLTNENTAEAIALFWDEKAGDIAPYLTLLEELKQAIWNDPNGTLEKLRSEYTNLLLGPNKLPAPPWESVYLTGERLIFQESTLQVRRAYLKYQFLPESYPHEADDHLAFELDFMARLAKLSLDCFEAEAWEEFQQLVLDQITFLNEHLLLWIENFATQMQNAKTHCLYPQLAELTAQIVKADEAFLLEVTSMA